MLWSENIALVIVFLFVMGIAFSVVSFIGDAFILKLIAAAVIGLFVVYELHHIFEGAG